MSLYIAPIELRDAAAFIRQHHRHHQPPQGHRFSLGLWSYNDDDLHGVCVVGRPVARLAGHPLDVAEVTRLCTDGSRNGCSILYAAAARAAQAMGYVRIQTYILESELGTSLRAAGWEYERSSPGGQWVHTDGRARRTDQPTDAKGRWGKVLNSRPAARHFVADPDEAPPSLL